MKNLKLTFITILLLLSIGNTQAQNSPTTKPEKNFFEVRDEMLKQIEKAKAEGQINEGQKWKDNYMAKFKRWEHFMLPRVGPTGTFFKSDAVYNAYTNYSANHSQNKSLFSNNWQAIGPFSDVSGVKVPGQPKNGVGLMNCLAQHPLDSNTLFAGTFGGGIWKTTDAGLNWVCLDNNLPSMGISDIEINPIHPDTMYMATGDAWFFSDVFFNNISEYHGGHYSSGIMMSADGGTTWTQTGFTYQQMQTESVYRIVIDPVETRNLLVGCKKGLFRSTDAGLTWTQLDATTVYDIQINPLDPSKYYAITNNGFKLKRSYDGGATFAITNAVNFSGTTIGRVRVSAADTSKIYVIRGNGTLLRSTNAGTSFQFVNNVGLNFAHQGYFDKILALSPVDTNRLLIGLVMLIKSVNKGATFAVIDSMYSHTIGTHVDFHEIEFSFFNTNKMYAVNDGGFYVSDDIGETWTSLNNGMNVTQYYKVGSSNLNPDLLLGGSQDNGSHLFDGQNWSHVLFADGMTSFFDKADENIAYTSSQNGPALRSEDGGYTFTKFITPSGFISDWVTNFITNPLNTKKLFLGGDKMYASNNRGDSWQIISPVLDPGFNLISIAQSPADTLTLYAATWSNIFVTHDNGLNWSNITAGLPTDSASITEIKTADNNANTVYVTFSGFQEGDKIYKTTDAGLTWINISGTLPNVPFNTIAIQNNSNNDMYAGCDFGVFFKNDTMSDWAAFSSNLPGVITSDLDINYRSSKLYAGTHGRGIYAVDLVTPVAPIGNDAAIAKITSPVAGDYCDSLTTPMVLKIKNFGSDTLYNATINYTIDNGAVQSVAWAGVLAPFQSVIDTVATITLYGGNHQLKTYTSNPNGTADDYQLNDGQTLDIYVGTTIAAFPFVEGFETGTFPPADWIQSELIWKQDTVVGAYNNSTRSAVANFYFVQSGIDNLITMRVDLTNAPATPFLVFSHAYAMYDATFLDTLIISVSSDCGDSWNMLYMKSAQDLTTVSNFVTTPFVPAANQWVTTYIDLTAYMGQEIKIRFEAHSGFSNLLYIDNINILQGTVGIAENEKANINVYPNPTNGTFNISDPDKVVQNIEVYDSNGKLLYSKVSKQNHEPIDMSAYQQSLYYIKMQTVKGMVTKKVSLLK